MNARVPPMNVAAEEAVLGAMLLTAEAVTECRAVLKASHFYKPVHQAVFEAICKVADRGEPVEPMIVESEIEASVGVTVGSLMSFMAGTPAATNAEYYAGLVYREAVLRSVITVGHELAEMGYSSPEGIDEVVDTAERMLLGLGSDRAAETEFIQELTGRTLDDLERRSEADGVVGTPSGFSDLDSLVGGFEPGALVIVGARPAMGKSAFGMTVAAATALDDNAPALVFSMEMSKLELMRRLYSMRSGIALSKLNRGELDDHDWQNVARLIKSVASAPLGINDNRALTTLVMRAEARRAQMRHGAIGMIVVDYLQLLQPTARAENRQIDIANISGDLKRMAAEFDCPVVALSQLSRSLEARTDKRPMLQDLRESGSLEQDADVVMFLYRDEVYNPGTEDRNMAEVIVAKNRSGETGTCRLAWEPRLTLFRDLAKNYVVEEPEPVPVQQAAF